jgi:hypothetical protein
MLVIWLLLTAFAVTLIYVGSKFCDMGRSQIGTLMILVGTFQLMAELVALL